MGIRRLPVKPTMSWVVCVCVTSHFWLNGWWFSIIPQEHNGRSAWLHTFLFTDGKHWCHQSFKNFPNFFFFFFPFSKSIIDYIDGNVGKRPFSWPFASESDRRAAVDRLPSKWRREREFTTDERIVIIINCLLTIQSAYYCINAVCTTLPPGGLDV